MSLTEVEFFFFLPAVLVTHWLLPRSRRVQNLYLLATSLVFYAFWNFRYLALVIIGATIDYVVVRRLAGSTVDQNRPTLRRKLYLATSLSFNLGALGFFKYERFFAESLNTLLVSIGVTGQLPVLHLVLPLGISFYTIQRIGYVLDVYWERSKATASYLDFMLFSCFFPQITAGPIARGGELLDQLEQPRHLKPEDLAQGFLDLLVGFTLKAWAADVVGAGLVDPVFSASAQFGRTAHGLAMLGYPLQVFGDFAGYSLMAIGVARLFGVVLPTNFNYPFLSKSLPELWRRWHITLNRWLFDYIFTPLTTSRGWFRGRLDLAMMITFLASGLWHGALWTFVVWGGLHGVGMVVQRHWDEWYRTLCRRNRKYVRLRQSNGYAICSWALTISFFVATLIPFRAPSFTAASGFVGDLLLSPGSERIILSMDRILAVAFIVAYHCFELPRLRRLRQGFYQLPAPIRGLAYGMVIVWLALKVPASAGTFIYQQF